MSAIFLINPLKIQPGIKYRYGDAQDFLLLPHAGRDAKTVLRQPCQKRFRVESSGLLLTSIVTKLLQCAANKVVVCNIGIHLR